MPQAARIVFMFFMFGPGIVMLQAVEDIQAGEGAQVCIGTQEAGH